MPTGKGIYEDEPREHLKTQSPESQEDDGDGSDPAPDDHSTENAAEASG